MSNIILYVILYNFFSVLCCSWKLSKLPLRGFCLFDTPPHPSGNSSLASDVPLKLILALRPSPPSPLQICNDPPLGGLAYFLEPHVVISVVDSLSLWTGLRSSGELGSRKSRKAWRQKKWIVYTLSFMNLWDCHSTAPAVPQILIWLTSPFWSVHSTRFE